MFNKIDCTSVKKNEWNHKIVIIKNKSKIISLYILFFNIYSNKYHFFITEYIITFS